MVCGADSARSLTCGPLLQTKDLVLQPVGACDIADMCRWLNEPAVAAWMSALPYPFRLSDARHYLGQIGEAGADFWTITLDGAFIGQIGIGDELGYWLIPEVWGRGFATQAATAALANAFGTGSRMVIAGVHPDNRGSRRVLDKLGFLEVGTVPGHFAHREEVIDRPVYCLTARRWQSLSVASE
jgi:RimJ/RimL family protein N-acetyltransferase